MWFIPNDEMRLILQIMFFAFTSSNIEQSQMENQPMIRYAVYIDTQFNCDSRDLDFGKANLFFYILASVHAYAVYTT